MAGKVIEVAGAEIVLADGLVTLPTEILQTLPLTDYARNGVVLANERKTVSVMHGEGADRLPVLYTVSIYVQRAPITEAEAAGVTAKAADGDQKKRSRAEDEQAKREREIDAACNRTQAVVLSNLQNIGSLVNAANGIAQHYGVSAPRR